MSSATSVGRSDISGMFSRTQIDRATQEIAQLEMQLSHSSDESEAMNLIGQIIQNIGHSVAYISPEEIDAPDNCMTWARKKLRLIDIHIRDMIESCG